MRYSCSVLLLNMHSVCIYDSDVVSCTLTIATNLKQSIYEVSYFNSGRK